jgi:hypothetical protein
MNNYLAQQGYNLGEPLSPGEVGINSSDPVTTLANIISTAIGFLTVVGAIYFMFMIITGAIAIISSGGDKGKYEDARNRITTGAIGFVVIVAAMFIMSFIALLLDIPNILNLREMIDQIRLP